MKDVLIPLGLLLFIGFFVYAIIHTARQQRKAKARVFRDFADKNGLRYQEEDDGMDRPETPYAVGKTQWSSLRVVNLTENQESARILSKSKGQRAKCKRWEGHRTEREPL